MQLISGFRAYIEKGMDYMDSILVRILDVLANVFYIVVMGTAISMFLAVACTMLFTSAVIFYHVIASMFN